MLRVSLVKTFVTKIFMDRTQIIRLKLIRRFFVLNSITIVMGFVFYYVIMFTLGELHNFWGLFRSPEIAKKVDNIPPIMPFLYALPEATNQSFQDISGITEPGAKVMLYSNGKEVEVTISDTEGKFTFPNVRVTDLPQSFYAKAEDGYGNISTASKSYTIVKDTEPPVFEVRNFDKESFSLSSRDKHQTIQGITTPDTTISVNGHRAIVNLNGDFTLQFRFENGKNELNFKATDKAGNVTEKKYTVNFKQT